MKTRKTFSAVAILAVMACSSAHAQVLGGNVGGALNGTLGGGLHDSSVLTNGGASGSFGGQFDTGSTLDSTMGRARVRRARTLRPRRLLRLRRRSLKSMRRRMPRRGSITSRAT